MEAAITEAVKRASPCQETFVGVLVERTATKVRLEPNWTVNGIKFGRTDRQEAKRAATAVVEHMQREIQFLAI
jgi:hypothetical protein